MNPDELKKNIDTIVIVMMENRSFDHVLGTMRMQAHGGRTDLEGIDELNDSDHGNPSTNGKLIQPFFATDEPFLTDLPHERADVRTQLAKSPVAGYTMNGFVQAYEHANDLSGVQNPPPMGLLTPPQIPVTSFLAREFAICDHWFAPIPTSTHPNRLMALSGYTLNDETYSKMLPDQDLLFDWLSNQSTPVRWRVYSAGLPFLTLMPKMWPDMLAADRFRSVGRLALDFRDEADATFPQVIVVEPDYEDSPIHPNGHACDNHPPLPMAFGEMFLKQTYEAVTLNPRRWAKTLFIVTYDEHGGFYDHVEPPSIAYVPSADARFTEPFESTGPRVPAILISPWVTQHGACNALFDHTSILQLLAERFGTGSYSAAVDARRAAGINSVAIALDAALGTRPAPDLGEVNLATSVALSTTKTPSTRARQAFVAAADGLTKTHGQKAFERFPELVQWSALRSRGTEPTP